MNLETLLESVPDYAKDIRLNVSSVLRQTELTPQQLWGTALASAIAVRNRRVLAAIAHDARQHLGAAAFAAAKSAAAIMAMNNVYYRYLHTVENPKYRTIPSRLRMNAIRTHGVEHADFELWCTAVSAINNCQACVDSHEKAVREKGLTEETILAAIRIAAVINSLSVTLEAEETLANTLAVAVR
jgi:alkyl hydroperoxide reductase subunit D